MLEDLLNQLDSVIDVLIDSTNYIYYYVRGLNDVCVFFCNSVNCVNHNKGAVLSL